MRAPGGSFLVVKLFEASSAPDAFHEEGFKNEGLRQRQLRSASVLMAGGGLADGTKSKLPAESGETFPLVAANVQSGKG